MSSLSPAPGVPQTNTKAKVAFVVGLVGGLLTFVVAYFPDNEQVQTWGGLAVGVVTILANAYAVYQTQNTPLGVSGNDAVR